MGTTLEAWPYWLVVNWRRWRPLHWVLPNCILSGHWGIHWPLGYPFWSSHQPLGYPLWSSHQPLRHCRNGLKWRERHPWLGHGGCPLLFPQNILLHSLFRSFPSLLLLLARSPSYRRPPSANDKWTGLCPNVLLLFSNHVHTLLKLVQGIVENLLLLFFGRVEFLYFPCHCSDMVCHFQVEGKLLLMCLVFKSQTSLSPGSLMALSVASSWAAITSFSSFLKQSSRLCWLSATYIIHGCLVLPYHSHQLNKEIQFLLGRRHRK